MILNDVISPVLAIFKYAIRKILFNRRWIFTLLMAMLVAGVMGYAGSQDMDAGDGATIMDVLILSFIMPVISMIYGSSLIRNEIDDKSITQVITAPLDRRIAYMGYYAALACSLSLIMLLINIVGWLAFFPQAGINSASIEILATMSVMSVAGAVVYSALFLASGAILSKPVFFGLFYAFVWETFIGSIPGVISKYTVKHFVRSIGAGWLDMGDIAGYDGTPVWASVAVLIGVTAFLLILGATVFREKEYP